MKDGFKWWLLHLLVVRALTQSCRALHTAPQQVQLPTVDAAKQFAVDFRMQATSYAAYMMVRDYQTSDASHCDYPGLAADVCKWASKDAGWERLVRAESMVAIAHQAFRAAEYDEAIIALEESLALRLFAYTDQKTLDRWQQGLVMPGSQYRHDKKAIADSLVLRSDCLVQLARANQDVAELTEATELLQLAAAELQAAQALNVDSQAAISMRMTSIAALATELLPRLSPTRLKELLDQHGISCSSDGGRSGSNATSGSSAQPPEWCDSPGELLLHLVPLLRLPVCLVGPKGEMLPSSLGCGSSIQQQGGQQQQQQHRLRKGQVPTVQPVNDPFDSFGTALLQKPCEVVAHYLQRMFFRLLSVVPVEYMRDLHVPCQRTDSRSRCISYLPTWVTAQAVTIDKRTGRAHVTGPSSCAVDSSSSSGAGAGSCGVARKSNQQGSASSGTCQANSQGQPQQQGALELCGFLHIRSLAPGIQLPIADGQLTQELHESLRRAADAAAVHHGQGSVQPAGSCSAGSTGGSSGSSCGGGNGVYYYYFPDIPAVLDHVVLTQGQEDSMYLLSQLDSLTQTHSLKRWLQKRNKGSECSEAALLKGRAPQSCSVLVPSIGDCAAGHLASAFSSASALLGQAGKHAQPPQARVQAAAVAAASAAAAAAAAPAPAGAASCGCQAVATTCRSASAASSSKCGVADSTSGGSSDGGASKRGRRHRTDSYDDDSDGDVVTSSSGSSRRNSNGSKRRRSKQSTDPYLDAPPYPHMYSSFARVDREIADRQLLEQMNKIERDKRQPHHDGPLIPLTLGMLVLICCLPFIVSKFRRSSSRQQQQQQQGAKGWAPWRAATGGVGRPAVSASPLAPGANISASSTMGAFPATGAANVAGAAASGPGAAAAATGPGTGLGSSSSGGSTVDSSHMQRLAAAAVKAALSSNDLELMEGALRQAEGAGMSNTANCVRLKELLAKRKRQAQQAKRQEQMRQQEQARRGRKGRKGGQDQGASPGAAGPQQQPAQQLQGRGKGDATAQQQGQQERGEQGGEKKPPNRLSAWFKRVFAPSAKKAKAAANSSSGEGRTLGRVSDSSSTAAAADGAATGLSRSCSISSSRSASSSMISSSPSVMGSAQLQLLAVTDSGSSRGCSPATSVTCSPQSSTGISHSGDTFTTQRQQQRDKSNKHSSRGSVTVAVAARGAKQQQQQQQQAVDPDVAELASSLLAVRDATLSSSRSSSPASSPQAVTVISSGSPAAPGRSQKQQQQQQKGAHGVAGTDVTSPRSDGASGNLPICSPPGKQQQRNSPASAKAAAAAAGGKGGKGKQQSRTVSVSAAAAGCSPELGHSTPKAVITACDSAGSTRGSSGTYTAATAAGVEPPATPAGAATASPLRADRHQQQQQQLPPPWQQQQQQQQQQRSSTRTAMSWLEAALPSKQRAAAVSEDGSMSNSSSCLNSPAGAQQQQQGAGAASTQNTPTKAKLNPKAAPYNPKGFSPSPTAAGAAAAAATAGGWHSPAGNVPGLILTPSPPGATAAAGSTGSSSWQQQQSMLAARAGGTGGNFAAAAGVASMLQQQDGGAVGRRLSCNGLVEPSAVTGMGGGLPPPGNLMGGIPAAAAAGLHGAQNMQQMLLHQQHFGLLSPHPAATLQQQQQAAAAWQQQQQQLQELQREEQLMAMLSALNPEEASAAAAAMGLGGAGGSAPQPLGTAGSSGSSGVTGGVRVDSSTSSSGEYRGHVLGPMASHGLGWMSNFEGQGVGLGRPPLGPTGLAGALSWQQQQQQQQFQRPSRISLPQDLDSQLPPGFSAESFTSGPPGSNSSSVGGAPGPGAFSPAAAPTPGSLASPASAVGMPVGSAAMLAGGSNPWSYVPAQGKPATPLLIVSEAATAGPLGMQGYGGQTMSMSMEMGQSLHMDMDMGQSLHMDMDHHVVAAAAATSTNVAELVLGSSPPPNTALHGVEELFYRANTSSSAAAAGGSSGGAGGSNGGLGMTAADADAHAARLADEMTAGVLD